MGTLLQSISNVRRHLLKPKENAPDIDSILGAAIDEMQNFQNELGNSSVAWTIQEFDISLGASEDVLIPQEVGKILFVRTNYSSGYPYGQVAVEFVDLRDASTDWWHYEPMAASRPEDYGYLAGYAGKIAFYRKSGSLYARVPLAYGGNLTVTAAAGVINPSLSGVSVLSEYHHLPEIRAAMNLLPAAEWTNNEEADERRRRNLMQTLSKQEERVYEQFVVAKRSQTAESTVYREACY